VSAITGIYFLDDRTVDPSAIDKMNDALAHRGPDGSDTWHHGPIGLGHRMLWTTPESLHEHLPYTSDDARFTITADARIDNRDELIAALHFTAPPAPLTDSHLILRAYERWGERCPEHLLGDFAFAIWDDERRALFCARDHMGVKPFYYYRSDTLFAFASEMRALFCLPEVPRRPHEAQIARYLASVQDDRASTFYEDILRLPAAHALAVTSGRAHLSPYWSLDAVREVHYDTNEEYERAFRAIFTEAVRCRLRSAFPVGSQLSGGLDSSSVTCVARDLFRQGGINESTPSLPLHTFSALFDDVPQCDERTFINAVIDQGDCAPHYVHPDRFGPFAHGDEMLWHEEEPFGAANLFVMWACYEAAHQANVRVILDGLDGDTTVSKGSGFLVELLCARKWRAVRRELDAFAAHKNVTRRRALWVLAILPLINYTALERVATVWKTVRRVQRVSDRAYVRSDVAKRAHLDDVEEPLALTISQISHMAREWHKKELKFTFVQSALEIADKAAAAFSLEVRHPFFDRRLVEFCLALPTEQKVRNGWTRSVVRRALDGSLPPEVQWRLGKSNLAPNMRRSLLTFDRAVVEDTCADNPPLISDYVNIAKLCGLFEQCCNGRESGAFILFKAALLRGWLATLDACKKSKV
jgi:asparagine synthase (glutamine-hydrolysing)